MATTPRPFMTTPNAYIWTTRGWPGLKPAATSLFLGLLLGPGAIVLGCMGHLTINGHAIAPGTHPLIAIAAGVLIFLIGIGFSLYLIGTITHLLSRYSIEYDHRALRYTRTCLGITRQRIIQLADMTNAEPFLRPDTDDDHTAYLRITLNRPGDDGLRLFMGSYPAATELAAIIAADRTTA